MEVKKQKDVSEKKQVALFSVFAALFITGFKLIIGLWTGSLGILSEALHSGLDLIAAIITYFSVRISDKPADSDHNYGHGKVENLSAFIETLLLLITCVWIIYEASHRLLTKNVHIDVNLWSYIVVITSIVIDYSRSRALYKSAKKFNSQALEADALHFSTDIWSSAVVLFGLICANFGYYFADSIAALIVAFIVLFVSYQLGKRSVDVLLDKTPDNISEIKEKISSGVTALPEVGYVDNIRVRVSGSLNFVDLTVSAKRAISLEHSHELADQIESQVKGIIPESDVLVHFHPTSIDESIEDTITTVSQRFPNVKEVHNIIYYRDKKTLTNFLSLHAKLDPQISLGEAHEIIDRFEADIKQEIPQIENIQTHIETVECPGDIKNLTIPADKIVQLKKTVMEDERLKGIHEITIQEGPKGNILYCHVLLDKDILLDEAHKIATEVETKILNVFTEIYKVIVHTEPC